MSNLSAIDIGIVVVYIAGTTLLGVWFARRQKDLKTYFVGGRNIGWGLLLASIVSMETSTVTFLSIPGESFKENGSWVFLQLAAGYIIGRLIIAWVLLPQYFRGECYSAYELLRLRFGPAVQRLASAIFILTRTIADGLRLYLTALLLHHITGWNLPISVAVMSVTMILYTFLGGMQAVIWTDLIQFIIYLLGAILAAWFIIDAVPGGISEVMRVGSESSKFQMIDLELSMTKPFVLWAGIIGGAFLSMASHGADQIMVQRYLCARSLGHARAALITSGFVVFAQFSLFLFIGVALFALHSSGGLPLPEGAKSDEVFGVFITRSLPSGMIGLVVAGVLAAAMSSTLNNCATALTTDFYRPLVAGKPERHYLAFSRITTVLFGVAQMGVALGAHWIQSEQSIVNRVLSVAGMTTGLILGVFLTGLLPRRIGPTPALIGFVSGIIVIMSLWIPTIFETVLIAWPWYAPIGALTTVAVAFLVEVLGFGSGSPTDGNAKSVVD